MATSTAHFSGIRQVILNQLDTATTDIKVAVAWFTNRQLFDKLCEKLENNVKVSLVIIDDFINNGDWGLPFQKFINLGGKLYYGKTENPMHHKFCIIDNQTLINGSYNWTYYAESRNVENIVLFLSQPYLVRQFNLEFKKLCNNLESSSFAIKRQLSEIPFYDLFNAKTYLSYDIYHQGKKHKDAELLEVATKLNPKDSFLFQEFNNIKTRSLVNKTITSLGIKSIIRNVEDRFSILIRKGREIPYNKSGQYYTVNDYQESICVEVFKGENHDCNLNQKIGEFDIDVPEKLAGQASITVSFNLDDTTYLTVTAKCNETGKKVVATYPVGDLVF